MQYESFFKRDRDGLLREGRSRVFADLERCCRRIPRAFDQRLSAQVTVWYSNDCLDNCEHPAVIAAMVSAARAFDTGSEGMRKEGDTGRRRCRTRGAGQAKGPS